MKEHSAMLMTTLSPSQRCGDIMRLHQLYGNKYVLRLVNSNECSGKTFVSESGDAYEREADRVAEV
jgi:hypothetical protein